MLLTGVALLASGLFSPVRAQDPDDLKRAVGRISLMEGQVSVRRGDTGDWVAGVINAPLLADDYIATGPNSRAEVQFDGSNLIRVGSNVELHLAQLEYTRYQLELAKGTATYRVLRPSTVNVEVDTPSLSVRPSRVGVYRISVTESGETEVTARAGEVEVFTPRGSQWVNSGQTMMARGSQSDPEFQVGGAIPTDEWDTWNSARDRVFLQSQSAQYVDPQNSGVYGVEELDNNGTWVNSPDYGYVWHPTAVGPDWAPYSQGRWVWADWYGWSWVSYDPWGWAPYHYGRWFYSNPYGWCWYPGARGYHHYWSPALVAWFGFGGGGGVGFGFGRVGWVPLAPYETFHPWWGRGYYGRGDFNRNIHITNVNITNVYRNARVSNGISGVSAGDFQAGRFHGISHFSGNDVRQAGLVRGAMPIAPTSANLRFSDRQASFTPRATANTRFFAHQQAAPVQHLGVLPRQSAPMQQGGGRTFGQNAPAVDRGGAGNSGWSRFGEPTRNNVAPQNNVRNNEAGGFRGGAQTPSPNMQNTRPPQAQGGNNGWQRFGNPGVPTGRSEAAPQYNAPRYNPPARQEAPRYNPPARQEAPRYNPPARQEAPRYNPPPRQEYSAPRYSAPQQSQPRYNAPSYSAPRSNPAPSYSAPRGGGGGGGGRPTGGGGNNGGGHSNGGGGGHRR